MAANYIWNFLLGWDEEIARFKEEEHKGNRRELRWPTGAGLFYQFRKKKRGEIEPRLIRLVTRY